MSKNKFFTTDRIIFYSAIALLLLICLCTFGYVGVIGSGSSEPTSTPIPNVGDDGVIIATFTPVGKPTLSAVEIIATRNMADPRPVEEQRPSGGGSGSSYTCNCSKTCSSMSCNEAYFQLNTCGCSARDSDGDGVPCESVC